MTGSMYSMSPLQFFIMLRDQKPGPRRISLGLLYPGYHVYMLFNQHTFPKFVEKVSALMCIWTNLVILVLKIRFGVTFA